MTLPRIPISEPLSGAPAIARRGLKLREAGIFIALCLLITPLTQSSASGQSTPGPTTESALAADQALARAMRENDAAEIVHWLDDSWAVISTAGGLGKGPSIFPEGIKAGYLTRKTFEISEPRVRLYGNTALVTTKVKTSGTFQGKPFDVTERQTDVLLWKDGGWKCVLTHETKISQ
jgi:ketosteroid isomerase-like protein